jgi:predicted nuclease of restriction endonuclease-like (RecB) superfamily
MANSPLARKSCAGWQRLQAPDPGLQELLCLESGAWSLKPPAALLGSGCGRLRTSKAARKTGARKAAITAARRLPKAGVVDQGDERFAEIIALIEAARRRVFQTVNAELVEHYWQIGEYLSRKLATAEWGDGVVEELAAALARRYPGVRGYTRRNLFRMRQFFEAYRGHKKVSPLVTQLPWTHHLIILSEAKPKETRELYILAAIKERWSKRELERQIRSGAVLRTRLSAAKVSPAVRHIHPTASEELKNAARSMSPTRVAEYQILLPPKELLRAKLHELYARLAPEDET